MSDTNTSRKQRDEYRRELERSQNRCEIEMTKTQSAFSEQQQTWHKKIQELDKDKTGIEEKLRGFEAFVENARDAGQPVDDAKISRHKAKLQDGIADIKTKRAELVGQAEADLKPYSANVDEAKKALQKAKEAVLGAKEYEEALKELEGDGEAAETPPEHTDIPA